MKDVWLNVAALKDEGGKPPPMHGDNKAVHSVEFMEWFTAPFLQSYYFLPQKIGFNSYLVEFLKDYATFPPLQPICVPFCVVNIPHPLF